MKFDHLYLKPGTRITEMFALCTVDGNDVEGLISTSVGPMHMPLVGGDMKRVEQLRAYVEATFRGRRVTLKRFKLVSEEVVNP